MTTLDLLILVALAGGIMHGFTTGLIKQVASIFGMIVAFLLAVQLMQPAGEAVAESIGASPTLAPLLGFVVVYLAVQLTVIIIAKVVEKAVGALKLSGVNRVLGGAAGAFKAALVLSVAFLVLGRFDIPGPMTQENSSLYSPVASVLPASWDYVASNMSEVKKISERFGVEIKERVAEGVTDEVVDQVRDEVVDQVKEEASDAVEQEDREE